MAKTSMIERDKKRRRLAKKYKVRRTRLRAIAADRSLPAEERFAARHIWEAVTDWQVWCLSLINMSVITPGASPLVPPPFSLSSTLPPFPSRWRGFEHIADEIADNSPVAASLS